MIAKILCILLQLLLAAQQSETNSFTSGIRNNVKDEFDNNVLDTKERKSTRYGLMELNKRNTSIHNSLTENVAVHWIETTTHGGRMKRDIETMIGNITIDLNNTDIRDYLPTLLDIFCPGGNICKDNKSYNVPFDSEIQTTKQCCSGCSCSEDCELSGKCCFPKPEGNVTVIRKNYNCYSSLFPDDGYNEQIGHKSYHMIDRELVDVTSGNSSSVCGDMEVAPWGNIYPVYSYTSKQIYKNPTCAEAYKIQDYIKWRVYVECRSQDLILQGLVYKDSNKSKLDGKCNVRFEFPGDKTELENSICYKKLTDTCHETFDTVTSVSTTLLQAACHSSLVSPYRSLDGINYKNAFCSVCNNEYDYSQRCVEDKIIRSRYAFSALFEDKSMEYLDQFEMEKKAEQACPNTNKAKIPVKCRPVLCPSGQIYDNNGHCVFLVKYIYDMRIALYLELISDTEINMTDAIPDSLISPWPSNWNVERYYYFSIDNSKQTHKIFVLLQQKFNTIEQQVLTSLISRFIQRKWTWKTNNTTIFLVASLSKARYWDEKYFSLPESLILGDIITTSDKPVILHYPSIKKLNYCKQVVINGNEFTPINHFVLINNITDQYMVFGEYMYPNPDDFSTIRVCVEDSGLSHVISGNGKIAMELGSLLSFLYSVTSMLK